MYALFHTKINGQKNVSPEHEALVFLLSFSKTQDMLCKPFLDIFDTNCSPGKIQILACKDMQNETKKDGCGGLVISSSKSWCYMKV